MLLQLPLHHIHIDLLFAARRIVVKRSFAQIHSLASFTDADTLISFFAEQLLGGVEHPLRVSRPFFVGMA